MISTNARVTLDGLGHVINVPHERLYNEVVIPQDGYMFIYIANESIENIRIYFDDFTVTQIGADIVKNSDYYPFGSILYNWQKEEYRFEYQGKFAEKDPETGWNNFELRMYDPVIGRWISPDPYGQYASPYLGMGNVPHMGADPNGGVCCVTFVEGVGYMYDAVVIEGTRTGGIAGSLPALVSTSVIEIPDGLMALGVDNSWYAMYPEDGTIYKHDGKDWQMHRNERLLNENYQNNLLKVHRGINEFFAEGVMFAMGGFAHGGMQQLSLRVGTNAAKVSTSLARTGNTIGYHAQFERLALREVTPKMLQTTINKGLRFYDPKNGTINYVLRNGFASGKDLLVGTNPLSGKVTTVIRGSKLVRPRFVPLD
jgi:RHS repeat-associated protein